MTFNEYQEQAATTAKYKPESAMSYLGLGLGGETGEVQEKLKKVIRDHDGKFSDEQKEAIKKELGDVFWYLSEISRNLGFKLDDVAALNIAKLNDRKSRGVLGGSGDNR